MAHIITFYVNEAPITRRVGTTVEKAVLAYDQDIWNDVRHGRAIVTDADGNRIDWGGSMYDGAHVYTCPIEEFLAKHQG
jgi:hypothetical protein